MAESLAESKHHFQARLVWTVAGIAWGAISYAYVASIIGTTLGSIQSDSVQ